MVKPRRMRMTGQLTHMRKIRNTYNISAGNPELRIPFTRPRSRWRDV
jgi:hypothetical protein